MRRTCAEILVVLTLLISGGCANKLISSQDIFNSDNVYSTGASGAWISGIICITNLNQTEGKVIGNIWLPPDTIIMGRNSSCQEE